MKDVAEFARRLADKIGKDDRKDGGAAFPLVMQDEESMLAHVGMSLRDWFAGRAMQSLTGEMASSIATDKVKIDTALANTSRLSYALADAMLRERDRK